ncbi:hypothetical protein CgunFtcFv8_019034 [Champsocephalus gunnari]|uniref:LysM and putative peptidoglycan-binding domain-containing protein 1 n=1 Tax=Champsocephalus gunnari TaxID=52237 RepID=A0AAN8DGG8_CHAGU|nr:hypothetical protein CgunFtcFv8_019034 [Champsocephalus gunnari]
MSGERAPLPGGGNSLLPGEPDPRRIEHNIQPGETLQGLALKYGVSMEQIKRANRLYTNDSIFLKKSLSIPVLSDLAHCSDGGDLFEEDGCVSKQNGHTRSPSERKQNDGRERASDLTPADFLKRLDDLISQSKQAAVRGCQEAEKRVASIEAACSSEASDCRPLTRSQSAFLSPTTQQASYAAVTFTVTKLTRKLRDREDEIFQL